jgi:hypothetical protein
LLNGSFNNFKKWVPPVMLVLSCLFCRALRWFMRDQENQPPYPKPLLVASVPFVLFCLMLSPAARAELHWTSSGPGGGGAFAGAAVSADGKTVIVPSDLGGLYRSTTGGKNWQAIGSNKGLTATHVDAVAFDPDISGVVLAGAQGGIYRSTDCGIEENCNFDKLPLLGATPSTIVTALSAAGAGVFYASGLDGWCDEGSHVWKSDTGGKTWDEVAGQGLPGSANIMALRVQRDDPKTILAISARSRFTGCGEETAFPAQAPNRAYLSRDGGDHFTPLRIGASRAALAQEDPQSGESWAYIEDVKFDGVDPHKIWAAVTANPDTENYWTIAGELWSGTVANDFSVTAEGHTGQLWPLSNGNMRSIDLRRQYPWNTGETGVWEFNTTNTSWHRVTTDTDYLSWDRGWVSEPGRAGDKNAPGLAAGTGLSLNGGLHTITPVDDTTLWWTTSQFAFSTADGGHLFRQQFTDETEGTFRSRGLDNAVPAALAASPVNPDTLYAGYLDMGCWHSGNASASGPGWTSCNGPKSTGPDYSSSPWNGDWKGYGGNTTAIAADPVVEGTVWMVQSDSSAARGTYSIAESSDHGATLADRTFDLRAPGKAGDFAITDMGVDTRHQVWLIARNRLFRLAVGNASWEQAKTPCDGGLMVLAVKNRQIFAGGGAGVCASTDGGKTWIKWQAPWTSNATTTWWHDGQMIDGRWQQYQGVTDFAVHPADSETAWMTVMLPDVEKDEPYAGLYKTRDGGKSWAKVELPAAAARGMNFARTVAVSPADASLLVVGNSTAVTSGGLYLPDDKTGVWVSKDGGETWSGTPENTGLAFPFMTRLRFAAGPHPRLWGISPGQGLVFDGGQ